MDFYASIVKHNGKPVLCLRRFVEREEEIEDMLTELRMQGKINISGTIKLYYPLLFNSRVSEFGLLKK